MQKLITKYQCQVKAQASCLEATSLPAHERGSRRASEGWQYLRPGGDLTSRSSPEATL